MLTDNINEYTIKMTNDVAGDFGIDIQSMNGGNDHVHVLFTAKPTTNLTKFINSLKGVLPRRIRSEHPEVKQTLLDSFWQPGYFLASTGQVSINVLHENVDSQ